MKKILLSGWILFLVCSCKDFDIIERCGWSSTLQVCSCHKYDPNIGERVAKPYKVDTSVCESLVGFTPEVWGDKITPQIKRMCRRANRCD